MTLQKQKGKPDKKKRFQKTQKLHFSLAQSRVLVCITADDSKREIPPTKCPEKKKKRAPSLVATAKCGSYGRGLY